MENHLGISSRRIVYYVVACVLMAACSSDRVEDLRQYVAETKARPKAAIAPMPKIETLEPFVYKSEGRREPFSTQAVITPMVRNPNGADPSQLDTSRKKEPLEAFSLDTMKLSGMIERGGEVWAIIKAPDSIVYWVKRGNYLGQNYGKIIHITESKVDLTETIPDGSGGWQSRQASLVLAE